MGRETGRVRLKPEWIMKKILVASTVLISVALLAGCSSTGGVAAVGGGGAGAGGALPLTGKGTMLAFRAPATVSVNQGFLITELTSANSTDRTNPDGVTIEASATEDKAVAPVVTPPEHKIVNGLFDAKVTGTLEGGTQFAEIKQAKGRVYFEGGNFGDPQINTENASISAVGVYNIFNQTGQLVDKIVMKEGTTLRYRGGVAGGNVADFGVGFIGNNTTAMPGAGTAQYKGFLEGATSVYETATGLNQMGLSGDVALAANFQTGKVTGGVSNGALLTFDNQSNTLVNLNSNITGLSVNADITGSEYAGSATLVDAAGNAVGTTRTNDVIGAFFGDGAAETAAAVQIEGTAMLEGRSSDYILTGVIGGVKK